MHTTKHSNLTLLIWSLLSLFPSFWMSDHFIFINSLDLRKALKNHIYRQTAEQCPCKSNSAIMHFIDKVDPVHTLQIIAEQTLINMVNVLGSFCLTIIFCLLTLQHTHIIFPLCGSNTRCTRTLSVENALLFHIIFVDLFIS